ncbi:MAG: hypothetical protein K2W95_16010 [Candidatus Obscuribacterales bacterium]|nr:hypothetical protein [Candidatus Obscuribacterales bacterium]
MTEMHNRLIPKFDESRLGRETEPVAGNLTDSAIKGDPDTALTTIAFLFGNVNPMRLTQTGVRTSMLALYAAGANVQMSRSELCDLAAEPERYANLFKLPENSAVPNGRLVSFVVNRARARGHRDEIPLGNKLENIGLKLVRLQLSDACEARDEDDLVELRTVAFQSLNPDPLRITAPNLALAMLAIWAAGADVTLNPAHYAQLIKDAAVNLRLHTSSCRTERVQFVLDKAHERAVQENLAGATAAQAVPA